MSRRDDEEPRMPRSKLNQLDAGAWETYWFGKGLVTGWISMAVVAGLIAYAVFGR